MEIVYLPPASEGWGKVIFSVYVSVHRGGGTYLPADVGYLPSSRLGGGRGTYLPPNWGGGEPSFQQMVGTYLPADRGGIYLPANEGYLPSLGELPTLARVYLPWPWLWGLPTLGRYPAPSSE